jgi:hypothetical protein
MKNIILSILTLTLVLVSCNKKSKETETTKSEKTDTALQLYACPMHPEVTGKKGDACSKCGMELTEPVTQTEETQEEAKVETAVTSVAQTPFSIKEIVDNYLALKNALTKDDTKGAANAGKELYATFNKVNPNSIDAKFKNEYIDIADDAKEHAKHIGDNASKIELQRDHFMILSKKIYALLKVSKTDTPIYYQFCPMANKGKGANWLSKENTIKNPYYGSQMLSCGKTVETIK